MKYIIFMLYQIVLAGVVVISSPWFINTILKMDAFIDPLKILPGDVVMIAIDFLAILMVLFTVDLISVHASKGKK